jgi:hypothetical protein
VLAKIDRLILNAPVSGKDSTAAVALTCAASGSALLHNPRYDASLQVLAASLGLSGEQDKASHVLRRFRRMFQTSYASRDFTVVNGFRNFRYFSVPGVVRS